MRLDALLARNDLDPALAGLDVAGLSADSRAIGEGFAFFAIPGHAGDGLSYVNDAKARGAVVVVAQRAADCALPLIVVPDVRAAIAQAAARFYPRQPQTIVAVTGTSGKTSVVAFLRQIWAAMGHEAASLGTVGVVGFQGRALRRADNAGPGGITQNSRRACRTRRDASRHGGVVARHRPAPSGRRAPDGGGLYKFFARSPRSPPRHGRVFRRENAAVRHIDRSRARRR